MIRKFHVAGNSEMSKQVRWRRLRFNAVHSGVGVGDVVKADVFNIGEHVDVIGVSKGKGFAGVVKKHHFMGGPRTHGQSDRERAPGSVGQTTTPGRVYKGKRMAGRMGGDRITVKNLKVLGVDQENNQLLISGAVPGRRGTLVEIRG